MLHVFILYELAIPLLNPTIDASNAYEYFHGRVNATNLPIT